MQITREINRCRRDEGTVCWFEWWNSPESVRQGRHSGDGGCIMCLSVWPADTLQPKLAQVSVRRQARSGHQNGGHSPLLNFRTWKLSSFHSFCSIGARRSSEKSDNVTRWRIFNYWTENHARSGTRPNGSVKFWQSKCQKFKFIGSTNIKYQWLYIYMNIAYMNIELFNMNMNWFTGSMNIKYQWLICRFCWPQAKL
jgi:hypothetical protein